MRKTTDVLKENASEAARRTAAQVDAGETPTVEAFRAMLGEMEIGAFTNYSGQKQMLALCNRTEHGRALIEVLGSAATLLIE